MKIIKELLIAALGLVLVISLLPATVNANEPQFSVTMYSQSVLNDSQPLQEPMDFVRPVNVGMPENFRGFVVDFVLLHPYVTVRAEHEGTLWATLTRAPLVNSGILLSSQDHGDSWTQVYEFHNPIIMIYCDDFGNIFVATTQDRWGNPGTGELFKSYDGGNTFARVLRFEAGAPFHWNIVSTGGMMFVSEYGFKGIGNNARRIYRSLDFGKTWEIVFNPPPTYNWHNHRIIISNGTIYQSIGDRPHNHIIRSIDKGETWVIAFENMHPTGAVVFDTHILWSLDSGANPGQANAGIVRQDNTTGMMDLVFVPPYPFDGTSYDMAIANGIVYALFLSYRGDRHPASIWYSKDEGNSWGLMGYITKQRYDGIGLWQLTTDERYGYICIQTPVYRDGVKEYFRGTLRFELLR